MKIFKRKYQSVRHLQSFLIGTRSEFVNTKRTDRGQMFPFEIYKFLGNSPNKTLVMNSNTPKKLLFHLPKCACAPRRVALGSGPQGGRWEKGAESKTW